MREREVCASWEGKEMLGDGIEEIEIAEVENSGSEGRIPQGRDVGENWDVGVGEIVGRERGREGIRLNSCA